MADGITENLLEESAGEKQSSARRVWKESQKIWVVAAPAMFCRFTTYGTGIITQAFVGHVGSIELAAFALVFTVFIRFAQGVLLGMANGLETLCGQAYGAGQYHMLGIYLQRSWLISAAAATAILPLFILTAPILKLLGQDAEIAEMAGTMSLWMIPAMYSYILAYTCQMYLQAQSKNMIIAYLSAASLALHVLLSWLLTVKLDYGVPGAMISTIIAFWLPNLGQLAFIACGGCPLTWRGFSMQAFQDLWPIFKLSLSAGAMLFSQIIYCIFV